MKEDNGMPLYRKLLRHLKKKKNRSHVSKM